MERLNVRVARAGSPWGFVLLLAAVAGCMPRRPARPQQEDGGRDAPDAPACTGPAHGCSPVQDDGTCAYDVRPAECRGGAWRCPAGFRRYEECIWPPPPFMPVDCSRLSAAACASRRDCLPLFENECCGDCGRDRYCYDCEAWGPFLCKPREYLCAPDTDLGCMRLPDGVCSGGPWPDCRAARPTGPTGCDVPGCVVAFQRPCDGCDRKERCVPLKGIQCYTAAREPTPDCRGDGIPEIRNGHYTGWCVDYLWCREPVDL